MERSSRLARRHGGGPSKFGERMRTLAGFWTKKKSAGEFLTFTRSSGEEHGDGEEAEAEIDVGGGASAALQASGSSYALCEGESGEEVRVVQGLGGTFYSVGMGGERVAVKPRGAGH